MMNNTDHEKEANEKDDAENGNNEEKKGPKIGLKDILMLCLLQIFSPSFDVFSDVRIGFLFLTTGRECVYRNNGETWTYSECFLLPTITGTGESTNIIIIAKIMYKFFP